MSRALVERRVNELVRRSHAGLDAVALRTEIVHRLRGIVTLDAVFFATVDPRTLLFTSGWSDAPLDEVASLFLANEYGSDDVNKFADIARAPTAARSLDMATHGDRELSARYREIMAPLGLGDELRVALRSHGAVWGVLCLHRGVAAAGFSAREIGTVVSLAPHLGTGLRHAIVLDAAVRGTQRQRVGLVVLDAVTLAVESVNEAGVQLLDALRQPSTDRLADTPSIVEAVARRAVADGANGEPVVPLVRCRGSDGTWLVIHASVLTRVDGPEQVAVVIEPASPADLGSFVLDAVGLTARERAVAELVLRGDSTRQIVNELRISPHTVQDHLKRVFAKVGVSSRRELVATLQGPASQHPGSRRP
ncbi:MAG TPA: LuxR C-terminal-related transcriptional regulator [Acidimicrobiia bacterium]|nr:LuxR C-terminal-related transcriptional regulator [Acidimicrobiia bacterium]